MNNSQTPNHQLSTAQTDKYCQDADRCYLTCLLLSHYQYKANLLNQD